MAEGEKLPGAVPLHLNSFEEPISAAGATPSP
jgi:hypothetical protein